MLGGGAADAKVTGASAASATVTYPLIANSVASSQIVNRSIAHIDYDGGEDAKVLTTTSARARDFPFSGSVDALKFGGKTYNFEARASPPSSFNAAPSDVWALRGYLSGAPTRALAQFSTDSSAPRASPRVAMRSSCSSNQTVWQESAPVRSTHELSPAITRPSAVLNLVS